MIEKIVEFGLKTFYKEQTCWNSRSSSTTRKVVAQALKEAEGKVGAPVKMTGFVRYALGEGIEKAGIRFRGRGRRRCRTGVTRTARSVMSRDKSDVATEANASWTEPAYRRVVVKLSGRISRRVRNPSASTSRLSTASPAI